MQVNCIYGVSFSFGLAAIGISTFTRDSEYSPTLRIRCFITTSGAETHSRERGASFELHPE